MNSPSDAEDVAQEALIRALEHEDRIPPLGRRNWLAATARNIALATKRSTYRRISRERSASRPEIVEELATAEVVALAEFRARAANAVVALPLTDRTEIVLRFYEGLSTAEVAARLGVEPAAARQRISRAVRRLRSALDEKDRERTWGRAALALIRQGSREASGGSRRTSIVLLAATVLVALGAILYSSPMHKNEGSGAGTTEASMAAITAPQATPVATSPGGSVTLIDPTTNLPAEGVEWFVIRSGDKDDGLIEVTGAEIPNPTPFARGTTGRDGLVNFSPGDNQLLHLATLRNESYAQSPWPVSSVDALMGGLELELSTGQRVIGRVVNDLGEPAEGAVIVGRDYDDQTYQLAICDETGWFVADRIAAFPRAFTIGPDGKVVPSRVNGNTLWTVPANAWSEPHDDPWVGKHSAIPGTMTPETHALEDIVLDRSLSITGRVVNQHGQPMKGALVTTNRDTLARVTGSSSGRFRPLPWSPGGRIGYGEALTKSDGTFDLEAGSRSLTLGAFTRSGAMREVALSSAGPGAVLKGNKIVVRERPGVQLVLRDPSQPGGALQEFGSPPRQARLIPDLVDREVDPDSQSPFTIPTSGVVTLASEVMSTLPTGSATLLIDGYNPVALKLSSEDSPPSIDIEIVAPAVCG